MALTSQTNKKWHLVGDPKPRTKPRRGHLNRNGQGECRIAALPQCHSTVLLFEVVRLKTTIIFGHFYQFWGIHKPLRHLKGEGEGSDFSFCKPYIMN